MKNLLITLALVVGAVPAMASKARVSALGAPVGITDTNDVFANPSKMVTQGDFVVFELATETYPKAISVATTADASNAVRAEGGFTKSHGDAKYGFYMGKQSDWVVQPRIVSTAVLGSANIYLPPENNIHLFYGSKMNDLAWGAGLEYSNSDKKTLKQKQSSMGLSAGVSAKNWNLGLVLGLTNTFKNDTTAGSEIDFKGKSAYSLSGTYTVDSMVYSAGTLSYGGKETIGSTETHDITITQTYVGAENSYKVDGGLFLVGAKYQMDMNKNVRPTALGDVKTETTTLPVYAAIEADAASWLVLRGSVTQNVLLGSSKSNGGDANTIDNNTSVGAGAGLKFGKLMIDGKIAAAASTTGALNASSLLTNTSLTYSF